MSGHGDKYSFNAEKFLANLLNQPSLKEAAAATGISVVTATHWLRKPEFIELYRQAKSDLVSHAIAKLQSVTGKAVQTLEDVMDDPDAPATAKVSAARVILESSIRAMEDEEISRRLEALEQDYNLGGS